MVANSDPFRNGRIRAGRKLAALSGVLTLALLGGCMSFNPRPLRDMEQALTDSNPQLEIASSMKIGIYDLARDFAVEQFEVPAWLEGDRDCHNREVIVRVRVRVRVREENEHVQVAVCIRDERISGVSVFVLEPREIVVVNAHGRFDKLIGTLIRQHMRNQRREEQRRAGAAQEAGRAWRCAESDRKPGLSTACGCAAYSSMSCFSWSFRSQCFITA